MGWKVGDRVEWAHMRLARFDPKRYHGTVSAVEVDENGDTSVIVWWDDNVETAVYPESIFREVSDDYTKQH